MRLFLLAAGYQKRSSGRCQSYSDRLRGKTRSSREKNWILKQPTNSRRKPPGPKPMTPALLVRAGEAHDHIIICRRVQVADLAKHSGGSAMAYSSARTVGH